MRTCGFSCITQGTKHFTTFQHLAFLNLNVMEVCIPGRIAKPMINHHLFPLPVTVRLGIYYLASTCAMNGNSFGTGQVYAMMCCSFPAERIAAIAVAGGKPVGICR